MRKRMLELFQVKSKDAGSRIEFLDYFRGMAMILVLLHHAEVPYSSWILVFHMPLLFFLSGYTESIREKQWKIGPYLKNRFFRLVVPYFLFEGVNLLFWSMDLILQGGWQDLSEAGIAILSCLNTEGYTGYYGRLWFFPCMFVSDILFFVIKRLAGDRKVFLLAGAITMLFPSWYITQRLFIRLPFMIDAAFFATVFLVLGYVFGMRFGWLLEKVDAFRDTVILIIVLFIMRISVKYGNAMCMMFINTYGDFFWSVVAAATGTIAFLIIVKWLYKLHNQIQIGKQLILWYSRNSLVTFPIHLSIKIWMWNHIPMENRPWYVLFFAMLIVNVPVVNFITKYMPFMLGKFPKKRQPKEASQLPIVDRL